jgi:hypothetical protein
VAAELFDEKAWRALVTSHVQVAREDGILVALPLTLRQLASIRVYEGDLEAAEGVVGECEAISTSMTRLLVEPMSLLLAAVRGDEAQAARLSSSLEALAIERGKGLRPRRSA